MVFYYIIVGILLATTIGLVYTVRGKNAEIARLRSPEHFVKMGEHYVRIKNHIDKILVEKGIVDGQQDSNNDTSSTTI